MQKNVYLFLFALFDKQCCVFNNSIDERKVASVVVQGTYVVLGSDGGHHILMSLTQTLLALFSLSIMSNPNGGSHHYSSKPAH